MPAVLREGRRPAQAHDVVFDPRGPGHDGAHPVHRRRGQEGAGLGAGVPADQPSAGLPGVRPGRGVPPPGPGARLRARRVAVPRSQADVSKAPPVVSAGQPGSRAVRAVRAVHPVLRPDLGRPLHRAVRPGRSRAGQHRSGRGLQQPLLRQHRADLSRRRADLDDVPVRGPALRPSLRRFDLFALRLRMQPPGGPPRGRGGPKPGPGQLRRQRRVAVRQGAVRVRLRRPAGAADRAAAQGAWARAGLIRRGAVGGGVVVGGEAGGVPGRGPAVRGGRIRAGEAGPHRVRDQRPRPPGVRLGGRPAGRRAGPGGGDPRDVQGCPRRQGDPDPRAGRRAGASDPSPPDPKGRQGRRQGVRDPPPDDQAVGRRGTHPVPARGGGRRPDPAGAGPPGQRGGQGRRGPGRRRPGRRGAGGPEARRQPGRRGNRRPGQGVGGQVRVPVPASRGPGGAPGRGASGAPSGRPGRAGRR